MCFIGGHTNVPKKLLIGQSIFFFKEKEKVVTASLFAFQLTAALAMKFPVTLV
jgi:hypothetical protein